MSAVMEKRAGARIARALNIMLLALVSLICLLPFVHMIAKSFSGEAAVSAGRVTFYPINFTLNTYRYVLQDSLFFSSFRNSVMITVGGTLPQRAILRRYRELGGELLTIGSDAHRPQYVGFHFPDAIEMIKSCGFTHLTHYEKRKAVLLPL